MYYILDASLNPLGVFSNEGKAAPFYDDLRVSKIADNNSKIWQDTLEISAPYGYDETYLLSSGNHLLTLGSDARWYCYRVYDWQDIVVNGTHVRKASCYNLAIWDFYHSFIFAKKFTNANSRDIALYITAQTNWEILDFRKTFVGGSATYEVPQGNVQAAIDDFITKFDCEVRAYVEVENGKITNKVFEIVDELGKSEGLRFEYRHNVIGLSRKSSDIEMYTKLYVFGGQDKNNKTVHIGTVNDGARFLLDVEANDVYNDGKSFLEGVVENPDITNPTALKQWGQEQLKKLNFPKYEYEVDVDTFGLEDITLGDRAVVVDFEMIPELTIAARVLEIQESKSNKKLNKIILGEFITIKATTPSDIIKLQSMAQKAQNESSKKAWKVELLTPDGLDFENENEKKRVISRVFRGDEDVTSLLKRSSFVWQKIDENGFVNHEWSAQHRNNGKYIEIGIEESLSTIRCSVTDDLSELPELHAAEEDLNFLTRIRLSDTYPQINRGVHQYLHLDNINKNMYWTKVTRNTDLVSSTDQLKAESYVLIRTDFTGNVLDFMTVKWGGHGSHFGFELKGNKAYIISPMTDTNKKEVWTCEFPYQAGQTITIDSSSVRKIRNMNARINLDSKNGVIVTSIGMSEKNKFSLYKKADYYNNSKINSLYNIVASDFGVEAGQVYQSCCLDFPYLYVTYGQTYAEGCKTYCVDIRTKTLIYQIDFTFDKGNINFYHSHAECEAINYYYDESGEKYMLQGLVLRNKNASIGTRQNEIYSFKEKKRVDEIYEEDLSIDDQSSDDEG